MFSIFKKFIMLRVSPEKRAELLKRDGFKMGIGCEVYPGVKFGTEPYLITIGDYVRITADVRFITHDGGVWVIRNLKNKHDLDKFGMIQIGNNVMIGTGAVIMPNTMVGNNCIIGAGSIVTKNVPNNSVVAGVPAKVISSIEDYYKKNSNQFLTTKGLDKNEKKRRLIEYYCEVKER